MTVSFRVDYIRDGLIEEFHTGILQRGFNSDNLNPYYLRSCAKPLQASLLIDYHIDFSQQELAFCCGSHAGEECHEEIAHNILNKLNLDESHLKCGIHAPLSRTMQDKLLINKKEYSAIHNNCSGKHLGFLALCKKNNWNLATYNLPDHPLQKEIKKRIYELCEIPASHNYPVTTDGCGVPIVSMPLVNILIGYKNLANNYPTIINAILNNPYIYGGENRQDTEIIQNSTNLIAKVGAGGLCVVYNTKLNDGFVVKINDASTDARKIAVYELLNKLSWSDIKCDKTIKTISGKVVGEIIVTNLNMN